MPSVGGLWFNVGLRTEQLEKGIRDTDEKLTGWARRRQALDRQVSEGGAGSTLYALRQGARFYGLTQVANSVRQMAEGFRKVEDEIERGAIPAIDRFVEHARNIGSALPFGVGASAATGFAIGDVLFGYTESHREYAAAVLASQQATLKWDRALQDVKRSVEVTRQALKDFNVTIIAEQQASGIERIRLQAERAKAAGNEVLARARDYCAQRLAAQKEFNAKMVELDKEREKVAARTDIQPEQKPELYDKIRVRQNEAALKLQIALESAAKPRIEGMVEYRGAVAGHVADLEREAATWGMMTRQAAGYELQQKRVAAQAELARVRTAYAETKRPELKTAIDEAERLESNAKAAMERFDELDAIISDHEATDKEMEDRAARMNQMYGRANELREQALTIEERRAAQLEEIAGLYEEGIIGESEAVKYAQKVLNDMRGGEAGGALKTGRGAVLQGPWQSLSAESAPARLELTMKEVVASVKTGNDWLKRILDKLGLS